MPRGRGYRNRRRGSAGRKRRNFGRRKTMKRGMRRMRSRLTGDRF